MNKPFSSAQISLCEGEQGDGKSNTAVARVIDAAISHIVAVRKQDGTEIKAAPLTTDDKQWLKSKGYSYTFDTVKLYYPDFGWKVMRIPHDGIIVPSINIFCNFHLYGVVYTFGTLAQIIEWFDAGIIQDGYLVLDENYIGGNAREGMGSLGRALTKYSMSFRKRHLHVILIYPHEKMADWIFRWAVRERIMCSNNEKTHYITLTIKRRKQPTKTISYYSPQYWKYYWTDEMFKLSTREVGKAVAAAK